MLGFAVLLPYALVASAFLILRYAVRQGSLPGFFQTLFLVAASLLSWRGIAVALLALAIVAFGLSSRTRWLGAACICLLSTTCLLVLVLGSPVPIGLAEIAFLIPCLCVSIHAGWLAADEWPAP
jgi:hypothetical protein